MNELWANTKIMPPQQNTEQGNITLRYITAVSERFTFVRKPMACDVQGQYLNRAGAAVDGWGKPVDCAIIVNQDIDVEGHIKLTVITAERKWKDKCDRHM